MARWLRSNVSLKNKLLVHLMVHFCSKEQKSEPAGKLAGKPTRERRPAKTSQRLHHHHNRLFALCSTRPPVRRRLTALSHTRMLLPPSSCRNSQPAINLKIMHNDSEDNRQTNSAPMARLRRVSEREKERKLRGERG